MQKLRVGVLMGGRSLEKEVSFNSGRTICDHLDTARYIIIPLFQKDTTLFILPWHFLHRGKTTDFEHRLVTEATIIVWDDLKDHVDFIYIAQHGRYAEDGTLQGFLEILGIPYVGSGVFASALRADKIIHKVFLIAAGIDTPRYVVIEPDEIESFSHNRLLIEQRLSAANINDWYVVKPYNEGSSLGVSVVESDDLYAALHKACFIENGKKKRVIVEEKIEGMEFTCIILTDYHTGNYFPLPPTEIIYESERKFFCYEQKYMPGRGIKRTPAQCSDYLLERIKKTCSQVMSALEFTNMSRIDGFVTPDDRVVIIDSNTFSGMAPSSFIFNQAAQVDMDPSRLINHIIETELRSYGMLDKIIEEEKMNRPVNTIKKIRVGIICGGKSNEKETSLDSGRNVFYKINRQVYDPFVLFLNDDLQLFRLTNAHIVRNSTQEIAQFLDKCQPVRWSDLPGMADFIFIALHGGEGEDGTIQGALEMLNIPYNGSSVLTSALCMNKYKANLYLSLKGFHVPQNQLINPTDFDKQTDQWQFDQSIIELVSLKKKLIVKPHNDGCSVMVQQVTNQAELIAAVEYVLQFKDAVLIEECIEGMELTVGVIGNDKPIALPPSQAIAAGGILTIEEKFLPGAGENQTPAPLSRDALTFVQKTIEEVYQVIQCKGYARIDCFYQSSDQSPTGQERVIILEINTLPGLTPATCLFHQAAEVGLRPFELIDEIIKYGFLCHSSSFFLALMGHPDKKMNVNKSI